jgi:WD40 repeat protein
MIELLVAAGAALPRAGGLPLRIGLPTRPFANEAWHELYSAHSSARERKVLGGHTDDVVSAAFSPDGRRILTSSLDYTARLWDAHSKPLATLQEYTGGECGVLP